MKFKVGDKVRIKAEDIIYKIVEIEVDAFDDEYVSFMVNVNDKNDYSDASWYEDELEYADKGNEAFAEVREFEEERSKERNEQDTRLEKACMALTNLEIELENTDIKLKDYRLIMEYTKCIRHDITELWQDWIDEKY